MTASLPDLAAPHEPEAPPCEPAVDATARWTPLQRGAFRVLCAYLVLYAFSSLGPLPMLLAEPSRWVAQRWLGFAEVSTRQTGSGDRPIDYGMLVLLLVLAPVLAAVWAALDRRRGRRALELAPLGPAPDALRTILRYTLAVTMLLYGSAKIIQAQFPPPNALRLLEPLGQFSPMGLLWTFMGQTYAFNLFTGLAESVGGALLFWRRTTLLGACILVGVLANVVVLNWAFDVPVKLYSMHLLVMDVVLLAPDAKRLWRFFVGDGATPPATRVAFAGGRWGATRAVVRPTLIALALIGPLAMSGMQSMQRVDSPLPGVYEVEGFARDGVERPALAGDGTRWRRLVVWSETLLWAQTMDDSLHWYPVQLARVARDSLTPPTIPVGGVRYAVVDSSTIALAGQLAGVGRVTATMRRIDESRMRLTSRGFHWVSPEPYNR